MIKFEKVGIWMMIFEKCRCHASVIKCHDERDHVTWWHFQPWDGSSEHYGAIGGSLNMPIFSRTEHFFDSKSVWMQLFTFDFRLLYSQKIGLSFLFVIMLSGISDPARVIWRLVPRSRLGSSGCSHPIICGDSACHSLIWNISSGPLDEVLFCVKDINFVILSRYKMAA